MDSLCSPIAPIKCTIDRNLSHVPHAFVLDLDLDGDRGHLTVYQPVPEAALDR